MKQLAIVCPSRGRPVECTRMKRSALDSSTADVLIYVDSDDPTRRDYLWREQDERAVIHEGPPIGRGAAVDALIQAYPDYRMYLIVSDDIVFVRNDWEQQVIEAMDSFGDDIGIVHLASETGESYVNWAIASKKWIDTLGWFNYPGCRNFCQDTILQALAEALDRTVFIEPKAIHHDTLHHPDYLEQMKVDQDAFMWYMAKHFGSDLRKLRLARATRTMEDLRREFPA